MVIELFGPPGVGKTTFACAVADRLRERGRDVRLVLSYRPSEDPLASRVGASRAEGLARLRIPAALQRLVRPMVESLAAAGHSADPGETRAAAELMRLLAPRNVIHSFRVRQYLHRLSRIWRGAPLAGDIVLFDQAFVQAVYTSALLARAANPEGLGLALDAVPEADLFVRLDAPLEILEARLAERRRRQGRIERLFDAWTSLESLWIFDRLHELLRAWGRPVICVDSTDQRSLGEGVDRVEAITVGIQGKVLAASAAERESTG
jgi:thymidylate kinase